MEMIDERGIDAEAVDKIGTFVKLQGKGYKLYMAKKSAVCAHELVMENQNVY